MFKEYLKQVAHKGQLDWDLDFINRPAWYVQNKESHVCIHFTANTWHDFAVICKNK